MSLKFVILILFLLKLILLNSLISAHDMTCRNQARKHFSISISNVSSFSNFNNFDDLMRVNCNQTYNTTKHVHFEPRTKMIIDKTYEFPRLIDTAHLFSIKQVFITNIKGFDVNSHAFFNNSLSLSNANVKLYLIFSKFDVFSEGNLVKTCDEQTFTNRKHFLSTFNTIFFNHVIYPVSICPLVFRSSYLSSFFFTKITNSFLIRNRLLFANTTSNKTKEVSLKTVYYVAFEIFYDRLTASLLNTQLFKNVQNINLVGCVINIDADLFKELGVLRRITFKLSNFRQLFHSGNRWMTSLNAELNVDLNNSRQVNAYAHKWLYIMFVYPQSFVSFDRVYEYPDEDFCIFKTFPHRHLVLPLIYPGEKINCSCTLKWLHFYYNTFNIYYSMTKNDYYHDPNQYARFDITSVWKYCRDAFAKLNCDLANRIQMCDLSKTELSSKEDFFFKIGSDIDLYFLLKWLQFVLLLVLQPVLCFLSILSNLLVILVITNKKKAKDFQEPMYKFMLLNAVFNAFYCVIMILKLVNTCVYFFTPSLCSSVYQLEAIQYFKIVAVFYLGNVLKTSANISYLGFTLSRLVTVSLNKDNFFQKTFKTLSIRKALIVIFMVSCAFNLFILFQYHINIYKDVRKDFPYESRNESYCTILANKFVCHMFNTFKIGSQVFNGILFVFLNIVIDFCLVRMFNKEINAKSVLELNKKKIDELKKKKEKCTKMIVINGLVYFISHMPRCASTTLVIVFSNRLQHFCTDKMSCDLINEEAEFFEVISMIANFFIFKCFNRNFSESWADFKQRIFHTKFKTKNIFK